MLVLAITIASGCTLGPPLEEYYDGTWLFREHEVRYLERSQGAQGEFEGGFFRGTSGSFGTETMIMFSWDREPGVRYITTLPASRFSIHIDEAREIPTVKFQFHKGEGVLYQSECHPSRGEVEKANPNDYLMDRDRISCDWACPSSRCYFGGLDTVIVRISSEALEKEIYLPK